MLAQCVLDQLLCCVLESQSSVLSELFHVEIGFVGFFISGVQVVIVETLIL